MEPLHRLSMNTSLKNARIFDDDAWDELDRPIKKVIKQYPETHTKVMDKLPNNILENAKIKQEAKEEPDDVFEEDCDDTFNENAFSNTKLVKQEIKESPSSCSHNSSFEEGELKESFVETTTEHNPEIKCETPSSPSPPTISFGLNAELDRMFDESPYNKELFKTLKIREETPVKPDNELHTKAKLKSAKRTVFNRPSPYKTIENDSCQDRVSAKSRLEPKMYSVEEEESQKNRIRRKKKPEMESDPVILARREKQIAYGKNTLGYDNYIKMIPRSQRKQTDPKTPPKFQKYSRRGWEGLVKQWRIRLHQFDPPDATE